jgi:hypothetical protein
LTGGAFGTRKKECVHGHSLADAYTYKKEKNGKLYTIRECRTCRCRRGTQFKARRKQDKTSEDLLLAEETPRMPIVLESLLDCGHDALYKPMPQVGDVLWCMRCNSYQVRVKRSVKINAKNPSPTEQTDGVQTA